FCYYLHLLSFPTRRSSDLLVRGDIFRPESRCIGGNKKSCFESCVAPRGAETMPHGVFFLFIIVFCQLPSLSFLIRLFFLSYMIEDRKSTRLNSSHVKISYA